MSAGVCQTLRARRAGLPPITISHIANARTISVATQDPLPITTNAMRSARAPRICRKTPAGLVKAMSPIIRHR